MPGSQLVNIEAGGASRPLSPSSLNLWSNCRAAWWFKYEEGLEDSSSEASAIGRALHRVFAVVLHRRARRKPAAAGMAASLLDCALLQELRGVELAGDPRIVRADAQRMLDIWLRAVAPSIQARAIERRVSAELAGVHVRGIVDVLNADNSVIDWKTGNRLPSAPKPDHVHQAQLYAAIAGAKRCILVYLSRTSRAPFRPFEIAADPDAAAARAARIAAEIRTASTAPDLAIVPNRAWMMCSRRYCAFAEACEAKHGGRVRD